MRVVSGQPEFEKSVTMKARMDFRKASPESAKALGELAELTLAIVAIKVANRLNIAFRTVPGSYRAAAGRAAG
jgi:hypothetical protein